MKELEKFKEIFEGLDCAYGITKKSTQFTEKGKNKTESLIKSNSCKINNLIKLNTCQWL